MNMKPDTWKAFARRQRDVRALFRVTIALLAIGAVALHFDEGMALFALIAAGLLWCVTWALHTRLHQEILDEVWDRRNERNRGP